MGRYERKKIRRDKRRSKEDEESERKRWIENNIELEEHRERERREHFGKPIRRHKTTLPF